MSVNAKKTSLGLVNLSMFRRRDNYQITNIVIEFVVVNMMYVFVRLKVSAIEVFYNKSMLSHIAFIRMGMISRSFNNSISMNINKFTTLPIDVILPRYLRKGFTFILSLCSFLKQVLAFARSICTKFRIKLFSIRQSKPIPKCTERTRFATKKSTYVFSTRYIFVVKSAVIAYIDKFFHIYNYNTRTGTYA